MVRELLCYLSGDYNLTRVFRPGMLAVLIEGFSSQKSSYIHTLLSVGQAV